MYEMILFNHQEGFRLPANENGFHRLPLPAFR